MTVHSPANERVVRVPQISSHMRMNVGIRSAPFYLPQFYPIPENDAWWVPRFTEWTNVAKARPLYKGPDNPSCPPISAFMTSDLPKPGSAKADMARAAGIEGFCYWHYWFGGGCRILRRVFDEVLATGKPNFPFAWIGQINRGPAFGTATRNMFWSNKRTRNQPISELTFARSCRVQRSALSDGWRKADFHCLQRPRPTRHQGVHGSLE